MGIRSVIDLRPDGEAPDQTPAAEMERGAKQWRMEFHYIPVPHETIPDAAVDALSAALGNEIQPTVLYCRSGRRAVRTFALSLASRPDGGALPEILEIVKAAGFSAEDLKDNIEERIARRSGAATVEK